MQLTAVSNVRCNIKSCHIIWWSHGKW